MFAKDYFIVRNLLARLVLSASALVFGSMAIAQAETPATPAPKATPAPATNPLKTSGTIRAFYFTRTNRNSNVLGAPQGVPNAAAFSLGGKYHAEYQFAKTPWTVGATYYGATPLGTTGTNPGFNPTVDNTLPGYELSTLGEMYLQYKNKYVEGKTGKMQINTPWAGPSDSRIVPSLFQGTYFQGNFTPTVTAGVMYMARFKSRVTSAFNSNTLLTSCNTINPTGKVPYLGKNVGVPGDPCNAQQTTKGFLAFYGTKKFANSGLVANVYNYQIYDIENLLHIDAKYNYAPKSPANPYMAVQYIAENDIGRALLGTIHNHTYGFQVGASLSKNIDGALSYNNMPQTVNITNNCTSSVGGVFGGVKGQAVAGSPGFNYCYGGSVASPYSDSYATDPLFTTTISQGLADVHKPGSGIKGALTLQTNNHRWKAIIAQAFYSYGLPVAGGTDNRSETNVDVQYFFNAVDPKKPYHGLSIRHRYADRIQTGNPFDFKYNRTQLEFTF